MTPLTAARADCEEAQAANDLQHLRLYNPSDEVDSLLEYVIELRDYDVPSAHIRKLLEAVRDVMRLNAAERAFEQTIAARLEHHATADAPAKALGVKSLAKVLRPLLARAEVIDADGLQARMAIRRLVTAHPELLAARSLRHELGAGPHDRLAAHVERFRAHDEQNAAEARS